MLFTSYEFIGFLLLLLVLYYAVPKKLQWIVLLVGSYLFYFMADPKYLLFILATTAFTFAAARTIEQNLMGQKQYLKEHKEVLGRDEKKAYKNAQGKLRRRWLVISLVAVLGILAVTKYTNFVIQNVNGVIAGLGQVEQLSLLNIIVPLGISFYTFQSIGYLMDVYRGTVPAEKNFFRYALFVSFFPQLIQGPISRFDDLSQTLGKEHEFSWDVISSGFFRVLWGYFKKLVVADRLLIAVSLMLGSPESYPGAYALLTMVFYTIVLYADFTGGIDITIGVAEMLGIRVKENFIRPYFSKSLKEYWRRWHISMCTWFKDYLFYPVSVSKPMQRISKMARKHFGDKVGKRLPVYLASFIVWLATGIWHGASWNFVVWGLLNWAVLMASEEMEPLYQKFHSRFSVGKLWIYKVFQIGRTFLLICVLNLFDCYEAVTTTLGVLASIFTTGNWGILWDGSLLSLGLTTADYGIILVGVLLMMTVSLVQRRGSVRGKIANLQYPIQATIYFGLFMMILLWGIYGVGYDSSQFIYNQF